MTWREVFDEIGAGKLHNAYLFHGAEEYIKAEALVKLRERLLPAGMEALNETVLDATASAQRIIESAETLPMFCEKRLVLVRDWAPLGSGNAKNEAEDAKRISEWLPNAPDSCVTVFYSRGLCNGSKAAVKALKEHGTEALFAPLDDAELRKWIKKHVLESGVGISSEAMNALLFTVGSDMTKLSGEIKKLAAYALDRGEIAASDVASLVTPTPESTIFKMIDALTAGRIDKAQALLKSLINAGEPRGYILYMITRQARLLYFASVLLAQQKSAAAIQGALGFTSSYGARMLIGQARRVPAANLELAYRECADAEFSIKSGAARDDTALNRLLLLLRKLYSSGKS